jgi:hypothetical protein
MSKSDIGISIPIAESDVRFLHWIFDSDIGIPTSIPDLYFNVEIKSISHRNMSKFLFRFRPSKSDYFR